MMNQTFHIEETPLRVFVKFLIHMFSYGIVCLIIVGCVGNLLSCCVFARQRKQDRASAQYLGILALVDLINLTILGIPLWLLTSMSIITEYTWTYEYFVVNDLGCKVWMYLWHLCLFMSSWIVTLFSLERMLITWSPLKMSVFFSSDKPRRRALLVVFTIGAVTFTGAFDWAGLLDVQDKASTPDNIRQGCFLRTDAQPWKTILALILTYGFSSGLPCLTTAFSNIMILVGIGRNRFSKTKWTKKEKRCTVNLILVSTFFFLFMAPGALMIPYFYYHLNMSTTAGYTPAEIIDRHDYVLLAQSLIYCNFAVNPILYTFCLPYYRKEIRNILCCSRQEKEVPKSAMTGTTSCD